MTESSNLHDDLQFIRGVVARREARRNPASMMWAIAGYVLIGYSMTDFRPSWAGWFFGIAGVVLWPVLGLLARRAARREGEYDRTRFVRARIHWFGGIALAVVFAWALAFVVPALRGQAGAQVLVVMIGLVYFLGGIHYSSQFLWLGPLLMIGGVVVGLIPHYGWTGLGIALALGLVIPTFFPTHNNSGNHELAPVAHA